jgi:hypothetical protein
MLEGTDLMAAYQPLGGSSTINDNSMYAALDDYDSQQSQPKEKENVLKIQSQQQKQQPQQSQSQRDNVIQQPSPQQQVQLANDQRMNGTIYDASIFNKQYEQEIRIQNAINEMKKKKDEQFQNYSPQNNNLSYFDKLFNKKKELGKILQFTLIIVLGLSIHYLIDHYLINYINNHDMSFERQLFIRLLYPIGILFILWNLKVFIK